MSLLGSPRAAWAFPLAILAVAMLVAVSSLRPAEGATTLTVCEAGAPACTYTTIQAALDDIPNLAPDTEYVLELAAETYTENITVNVAARVEFVGVSGGSTVLDGGGAGRVIDFQNAGGSVLILRDMRITGGNAAGDGGGIRNGGALELYGVIMWTNTASNRGGAIHSPSGTSLTIEDAAFAGNTAGLAGSSMQSNGTLSVTRALIDGETVDRQGASSGSATITDSAIVNGGRVSANSVVTVSSTWWGVSTGPTGATLDGVAVSDSHITGLTVTASPEQSTSGTSVTLTVTPTLSSGTYDGSLTATVARTGVNAGSTTATGDPATTSYTGVNAGADTVTATMLFGGQTGGAGALTGSSTVTWLAAPVADAGGPYVANEGDTVAFDGTGSTSAAGGETYLWDFGGGVTSTDATTSHTYTDNGSFSPTLTVTDANGSDEATASVTISNVAPSVSAGNDVSVTVGSAVNLAPTFTDPGADAWTYTVNWDASGQGQPSAPANAGAPGDALALSNTYNAAGTYTVEVCVTDGDGGSGCDTVNVQVNEPQPPPPPPPPLAATATPSPTPTPSPTATPTVTPTATPLPTASPSPSPTAAPTPSPTAAPTPPATPVATVVPAATAPPSPTLEPTPAAPTPAAIPAASPASTPAPSVAAPSPGGALGGSPPSSGGGAPTAPGPSAPESNDGTQGGEGSGQQAVVSVAPGEPPASLLQSVDTSKTRGGKVVPPAEAETRAQIRNITTAGAGFSGGVVPWFAAQSIDERAVAGALVSGGAFLPLMFGSGPGGSSGGGTPAGGGSGGGAPGDSPRSADRADARRNDDSAGNDEGDDDVAAT